METGAIFSPKTQQIKFRRKCVVSGCKSNAMNNRDLVFHSFPINRSAQVVMHTAEGKKVFKDQLQLWLEKCNIQSKEDLTTASSFVCSRHFTYDDYCKAGYANQKKSKRILKRGAYPTVNLNIHELGENQLTATTSDTPSSQIMETPQVSSSGLSAVCSSPVSSEMLWDDEMQTETMEDVIRPPDMLCAIYSLPDANPADCDTQKEASRRSTQTTMVSSALMAGSRLLRRQQSNTTDLVTPSCDCCKQDLPETEGEENFYSRCLLCTCRPDGTPHLEILSEAGNELKLAEKLDKYLHIQVETELPQRVCRSCMDKLEVTHELVASSQRARTMLLRIKKQSGNFSMEVQNSVDNNCAVEAFEHVDIQQTFKIKMEPDSEDSNCSMKDSKQPAGDSSVIDNSPSMVIKTEVIPMENPNTNSPAEEMAVLSSKKPKLLTYSKKRAGVAVKPGVSTSKVEEEMDGPSEEDFVKCSQCPQVIYKGYLQFHTDLIHGELKPMERKILDKRTEQEIAEDRRRELVLDVRQCKFCKKRFYSQILDVHVSVRHSQQTPDSEQTAAEVPESGISRLMQCPACPCMFYPEYMQGHIAEEHPPEPNPDLARRFTCDYCDLKIRYCDMDEHLDSEHGPNAWKTCMHCRRKVRNNDTDMEIHLFQAHPGGKLLVCEICDGLYSLTGKEQAHMQTFISCKYKCPLQFCKQTFGTRISYLDHINFFHAEIEKYMQDEVIRELEDIIEVNRPLEDSESDEENPVLPEKVILEPVFSQVRRPDFGGRVDCDICQESMKHKWYLIQHKNKVHHMHLPFNCVDCGKNYSSMQGILDHLHRTHMPKDFVCETCGEAFTKRKYATHLKWHERYPNGAPQRNLLDRPLDPVRCGICNRPARNKYALLTHINSEHLDVVGERLPFSCEPCNKEFVTYEYLMQHHYSVHLPKLICNYCGKLINQNRMSMHLKLHEPDRQSDYKGKKRGRKPTKGSKK